jgi:hypothetical protein
MVADSAYFIFAQSVNDTFVLDLIKARKIAGLQLDEKALRITAGSVQLYSAKLAK